MKIALPLGLISATLLLCSCDGDSSSEPNTTVNPATQSQIQIGVISDLHIFDKERLGGVRGEADFEEVLVKDRKALLESADLARAALSNLINRGNTLILIPGDLTKDGEVYSHEMMRDILIEAEAQGATVLVIPGNHDINNPYGDEGAIYLTGNSEGVASGTQAPYMKHLSEPEYEIDPFAQFYAQFGYDEAIYRDSGSYSYVAEPVNGLWIMGLDLANSSLTDAQTNWQDAQGLVDYAPTAGSLLQPARSETLEWARAMAAEAKAQGKVLIAMSHFGVVEHFSGQNTLIPDYVLDGDSNASYLAGLSWDNYSETVTDSAGQSSTITYYSSSEYVSRLLADAGISLVLTGHFHANDIAKRSYDEGRYLIDIQTGATVSYPASFREMTLNLNQQTLSIATDITSTNEAVPEAALEAQVDMMADNLLAAMGYDIPASMQSLLNAALLDRPIIELMIGISMVENGQDESTAQASVFAALPADVDGQALGQMTMTQLIAATLKAHYAGDESLNQAFGHSERYAIGWLSSVNPLSLLSLMEGALAAQAVEVPTAMIQPFCTMVPLMGRVSLGIISDVTPDLNVEIDLTSGAITAQ